MSLQLIQNELNKKNVYILLSIKTRFAYSRSGSNVSSLSHLSGIMYIVYPINQPLVTISQITVPTIATCFIYFLLLTIFNKKPSYAGHAISVQDNKR